MKKLLTILCALFLVLSFTGIGIAGEIPFQISGGSLDVTWDWGGGFVGYTPTVMSEPVWLGEGASVPLTFGQVNVPIAAGGGTAEFGVHFSLPNPDGTVSDVADFWVISFLLFALGDLTFGPAETFGYSYGGLGGGEMTLDFNDMLGIQCGTWVDITGTLTNTQNPVPEPATLLLLGSGLVGLAGFRKKFRKS